MATAPQRKRTQVFRRSFVGCWTCRRRKVKCDAKRPHCDRCVRAKIDCEGYDIKLNWSMPLTNLNGTYCSLSGKPVNGGDDKAVEIEMQPDSTTIQRSNIDLVRWWLYDFYHEMDNSLMVLEKTQAIKSGPFGVIRSYPQLNGNNGRPNLKRKRTPHQHIRQEVQQEDDDEEEEYDNEEEERYGDEERVPSLSPSLSSSNSPRPTRPSTRMQITKSPSLTPLNGPVPITHTIASNPQDQQQQQQQPVRTPTPPLSTLQPFRDITTQSLHCSDIIELTRATVVDHGHFIQMFIDSIPDLFDQDIKGRLSAKVREITGNYVITDKPLDLCLILSIITLMTLKNANSKDHTAIFKAIAYKQKIDSILANQSRGTFHQYEPLAFLLVLLVMINSTLGVYDPRLFQFPLDEYHLTDPLMQDYYKFFQSTNVLLNHSQFQFDSKFMKIYADMLDPEYNLLKKQSDDSPKKPRMKMDGEIKISSTDTPEDKIIRVPKYIDEDHPAADDDDDNDPPPPTFTIHFEGFDKSRKKRPHESSSSSSSSSNHASHRDGRERALHDEVNEESESEALEESLSLVNVFYLPTSAKDTKSVYGISKNLIILYTYLCQLVNHRRHFVSVNMNSRNFAKVCADFEDVLMRQAPSFCHSQVDEQWYHLLVIIYFKLVQNYPRSMLIYHLRKVDGSTAKIGLFKFFTSMGGELWSDSDDVWGNNWVFKEWLWKNRSDSFKDWHYDEEVPKGMFLF